MGSLYLAIFTSSIFCFVNGQIPVYFSESSKISRDFVRESKSIDPNWVGAEVWTEGEPKSLSKFKMTLTAKFEHKLSSESKKFFAASDNTYTQLRVFKMVESWQKGNTKIIAHISDRWQILKTPGPTDLCTILNGADCVMFEYIKRSTVGDNFETTACQLPQNPDLRQVNIPFTITFWKWVNRLLNKNYYYFEFNLSYISASFSYKIARAETLKAVLTGITGRIHSHLYSTHTNNSDSSEKLKVEDVKNAKASTEKGLEKSEDTTRENEEADKKQERSGTLERHAEKFFSLLKEFWSTKPTKKSEKKEKNGNEQIKSKEKKKKRNKKENERSCSNTVWVGTKARCYTYVVVDGCFRCSETAPGKEDMVSKHAMHANAASELFYAGEFCVVELSDAKTTLHIDNDSNTYRPHKEDIIKMKHLMQANFPDIPVFLHDTTDNEWMDQKLKWKTNPKDTENP